LKEVREGKEHFRQRTGGQALSVQNNEAAQGDPEYQHQESNYHSRISQLPPVTMYLR